MTNTLLKAAVIASACVMLAVPAFAAPAVSGIIVKPAVSQTIAGGKVSLNPQPIPPGERVGLNPQPIPPKEAFGAIPR